MAATPNGDSWIVSWSRVTPMTTLAIGSKAMLVAIAGASAPVERASWFRVSEI